MERIALFIDKDNLYAKNNNIDLQIIKDYIDEKGLLVFGKIYFRFSDRYDESKRQDKFLYKLWSLNLEPIYCPVFESNEIDGKSKSLADPMIIVDIMETLLKNNTITAIVLITGDKDFIPIIRKIKEYGKKVILISTDKTAPALIRECTLSDKSTSDGVQTISYDSLKQLDENM
ncbi:MAG: NYN domain-containing protein [Candidatus Aenigmarchaeota archaeon]|nr:NYN domain-containing protein [Candidatus Aenigmarchaeota archaeon]